jgi:two-component system nitrogen regulation sensor histidine kinase NtrY
MTVVLFLISFGAIWLGLYLAKVIVGPIGLLAEATREVALGNYSVALHPKTDDEAGQLMQSFNSMTKDLYRHKTKAEEALQRLALSNDELQSKRQYMEVVFAHVAIGVVAINSDGKITVFNPRARELLQITDTVLIGKTLSEVLAPRIYDFFEQELKGNMEDTLPSKNIELDLRDAGLDLVITGAIAKIRDNLYRTAGIVIVFDNATERVRVHTVMAWREVAKRLAHEIKNPITPIQLNSQRLLKRFSDKFTGEDREVFVKCLNAILQQVESLTVLVSEFSRLARLPILQTDSIDMLYILKNIVMMYEHTHPEIKFVPIGFEQSVFLTADREQINRVFINLIANAVDSVKTSSFAGQPKIEVEVEVLSAEKAVKVQIRDNGRGVPTELMEKISDSYFTTKPNGTGLGLAIVKSVVEDLDGEISFYNNEPQGLVVSIKFQFSSESKISS